MSSRNISSPLRGVFLLMIFLLGDMISDSGAKGMPSGWLVYGILAVLAVPAVWVFSRALREGLLFGGGECPASDRAALLLLSAAAVLIAGSELRIFVRFLTANELNQAGDPGNRLLISLVMILILLVGQRNLETAVWLLGPVIMLFFILSFCLTVPQAKWSELLPLAPEGLDSLFSPMVHSLFSVLLLAVYPIALSGEARESRGWQALALSAFCGMSLLCGMAMRNRLILGASALGLFRYPSYAAANAVRHGEVLILCAYVLCQTVRLGIFARFLQAAALRFSYRGKAFFPWGIVLLVNLISLLPFPAGEERTAMAFSLACGGAIVLALLIRTAGARISRME